MEGGLLFLTGTFRSTINTIDSVMENAYQVLLKVLIICEFR